MSGDPVNDFGISKPATPEDADGIAALARTAFVHDRLHTDPAVSNEVAGEFKAQWVRKALSHSSRRRVCYVIYELDPDPSGFIICFVVGNKLVIDLIAVREKSRGQGISKLLILEAAARLRTTRIRAGTQSTNLPARNLYASLGMKVVAQERTFHR